MTESLLFNNTFPRSNAYSPEWIMSSASGGANSVWLTEWLAEILDLRPGMKLLDLGCGRAASSIFLAREFGVQVWATDLWFDPYENMLRIRDAGVADGVYPIKANARDLPFAAEFFDAVISIDAFSYIGTDDHYLNYVARFVKPLGTIAIAQAGFVNELDKEPPQHLDDWLKSEPLLRSMHSPNWWREHWGRSGIVDVVNSEMMPNGWQCWLDWHRTIAPDNHLEIQTIESDRGENLGYLRVVGQRRANANLDYTNILIPSNYTPAPLLRQ